MRLPWISQFSSGPFGLPFVSRLLMIAEVPRTPLSLAPKIVLWTKVMFSAPGL